MELQDLKDDLADLSIYEGDHWAIAVARRAVTLIEWAAKYPDSSMRLDHVAEFLLA